jgi:hypothetical protein
MSITRRGATAMSAIRSARDGPGHDPDSMLFDAYVCASVQFDEDADGIDDRCDACPTIASDGSDTDGDGLPNACDPDLAPGEDAILFAALFRDALDVVAFTTTNTTQDPVVRARA